MPRKTQSAVVACRLVAADHKDRLAWFEDLNAGALHGYRCEGARIELTYDRSAATRVRKFVQLEQECCPFLDFTIRDDSDACVLIIEVPYGAREAADELCAGAWRHDPRHG